jgi:hypothetical protein
LKTSTFTFSNGLKRSEKIETIEFLETKEWKTEGILLGANLLVVLCSREEDRQNRSGVLDGQMW